MEKYWQIYSCACYVVYQQWHERIEAVWIDSAGTDVHVYIATEVLQVCYEHKVNVLRRICPK